jgi:hypothetical protein
LLIFSIDDTNSTTLILPKKFIPIQIFHE